FACALAHRIRHNSKDADRRKNQCQYPETAQQDRRDARRKERQRHMFGHCFNAVDRQIRVKLLKLASQRCDHSLRVDCGANKKRKITSFLRTQIDVYKRRWILAETEVLAVAHYSDDFNPWPRCPFETEPFPDCGFTRPEASGESFVDDRGPRSCIAILINKIATFQQIDSKRCKIAGRCVASHRTRNVCPAFLWRAFGINIVV